MEKEVLYCMHYASTPQNPKDRNLHFLLGYLVDSAATLMYDKQHQALLFGIYGLFAALVLALARNRSAPRISKL
jgi:hypothetical protein